MKKIKFLLVAFAALMSGVTMAQKVTCADVSLEQGGSADLEFMIESDLESTLCEFFLTMPEGIAIEQEDGDYIWTNGTMLQRTHSVSIIDRPAGDIYVLIKNESGKNFKTTSGQLLIVPIVAGNVIDGTYKIGVDGVNITNLTPEQINTETSFTINVTVGEPTGIDEVNAGGFEGDGKYLKDGQVIIKKGDKVFTAVGTSKK